MQSAPSIDLNNISLNYQGAVLFDHLNFTLPGGQWTCLLGPSGVGKSSLLRFIAGLTVGATTSGTVTASDLLPLDGRLAYLAQQDLLLPWRTVLENVTLGACLRGEHNQAQQINDRALALLVRVGLQTAAQKKPAALSGGMRQRVALARTLMEDRPVVLMDEPFAAVDAITRLELQDLAAELLINKTVLLVTHDPLEALRLGQQIYVMAGQPAQIGAPLHPAGSPPRDLQSSALLQLQAELLQQLSYAKNLQKITVTK